MSVVATAAEDKFNFQGVFVGLDYLLQLADRARVSVEDHHGLCQRDGHEHAWNRQRRTFILSLTREPLQIVRSRVSMLLLRTEWTNISR